MKIRLALDAMGGDLGTPMVVAGANSFLKAHPHLDVFFTFYGDLPTIQSHLNAHVSLLDRSKIVHADDIVTNDTKPSSAVRKGRHSNLGMAISSVVHGENDAVVSAGNTGAYMALSKIILKTLPGVDRPAIPALLPAITGATLMLDLGANTECSPDQLLQFALMGDALAHHLLHKEYPTVGLLNMGSEELKGNATVQEAAQLFKATNAINFYGFVEGDDIAKGTTDVVVTDGFTGNIALKTIEGTARLMRHFVQESMSASLLGKLGYLIASSAFKEIKRKSDPRFYNGAVFLGLEHIAVKSHGGMDGVGFANALRVAVDMVDAKLIDSVRQRLLQKTQLAENF